MAVYTHCMGPRFSEPVNFSGDRYVLAVADGR